MRKVGQKYQHTCIQSLENIFQKGKILKKGTFYSIALFHSISVSIISLLQLTSIIIRIRRHSTKKLSNKKTMSLKYERLGRSEQNKIHRPRYLRRYEDGISHWISLPILKTESAKKSYRETELRSFLRDSLPCVFFIVETATGARNAHYVPKKVTCKCTIRF